MTWFVSTSDIIGMIVFAVIAPPIFSLWFAVRVFKTNKAHWAAFIILTIGLWAAEAGLINWWLA